MRDDFDFNQRILVETPDFHGGLGRAVWEPRAVDAVHFREHREVDDEDVDLRNTFETGAGGTEDQLDIVDGPGRLLADGGACDLSGGRVDTELA